MDIKTKRTIARELLIFIVPIIVFALVGILVGLYLSLQRANTYKKYHRISEEIRNERTDKVDSLKKADQQESIRVIENMKKANESQDNIELVERHMKNKTYDLNAELTNVYGDTITMKSNLLQERAHLETRLETQRETLNNFTGNNLYDGILGLVYGLFLIIAYPIRLIFYTIVWAIRTLRTT